MTYAEAVARMLDWAEGRRSHINAYMAVEASPETRPQTLAMCEVADASEVAKWSAVAQALAVGGDRGV